MAFSPALCTYGGTANCSGPGHLGPPWLPPEFVLLAINTVWAQDPGSPGKVCVARHLPKHLEVHSLGCPLLPSPPPRPQPSPQPALGFPSRPGLPSASRLSPLPTQQHAPCELVPSPHPLPPPRAADTLPWLPTGLKVARGLGGLSRGSAFWRTAPWLLRCGPGSSSEQWRQASTSYDCPYAEQRQFVESARCVACMGVGWALEAASHPSFFLSCSICYRKQSGHTTELFQPSVSPCVIWE